MGVSPVDVATKNKNNLPSNQIREQTNFLRNLKRHSHEHFGTEGAKSASLRGHFQSIISNLSIQTCKARFPFHFSTSISFGRVAHTRNCSAFNGGCPRGDICELGAKTSYLRRWQQMHKNAECMLQCCGDADVRQRDDRKGVGIHQFRNSPFCILADMALGEKLCKRSG